MEYLISNIIKQLTKTQRKGKKLINKEELMQIITPKIRVPKINCIDITASMIDNAIKKMEKEREEKEDFYNSHWQITISEAARITGISRQSFYRWINKGIIKTYSPSRNLIDLLELKETIKQQQKVEQNLFNKPIK